MHSIFSKLCVIYIICKHPLLNELMSTPLEFSSTIRKKLIYTISLILWVLTPCFSQGRSAVSCQLRTKITVMMCNVFYYLLALASLILVSEKEETNFGKLKTSRKIDRCGENLKGQMGGVAPTHWGQVASTGKVLGL